jgi:hypothetical protein
LELSIFGSSFSSVTSRPAFKVPDLLSSDHPSANDWGRLAHHSSANVL